MALESQKKSAKKQKKIEVGAKFGKLTIFCLAMSGRDLILICSCECFQIVKLSEAELKNRTACLRCTERKDLKKFIPGEIVIYRNAIGTLPFGAQAIINRLIKTSGFRLSKLSIADDLTEFVRASWKDWE